MSSVCAPDCRMPQCTQNRITLLSPHGEGQERKRWMRRARMQKGEPCSCRAKPHLRLHRDMLPCLLMKPCMRAWISASEHTSLAFSRPPCWSVISALNIVPLYPLTIPARASAHSSTASRLLCHWPKLKCCGARDWPLPSRFDAISSRSRHSRAYYPRTASGGRDSSNQINVTRLAWPINSTIRWRVRPVRPKPSNRGKGDKENSLITTFLTLDEMSNHSDGRVRAIPPLWRLALKTMKRGTEWQHGKPDAHYAIG